MDEKLALAIATVFSMPLSSGLVLLWATLSGSQRADVVLEVMRQAARDKPDLLNNPYFVEASDALEDRRDLSRLQEEGGKILIERKDGTKYEYFLANNRVIKR